MVIFRSFLLDYVWVPTSSMAPTIYRGDMVLVAKYRFGYSILSLTTNIGYILYKMKMPTSPNFRNTPSKEENDQIRVGMVPYYKFRSPQIGQIIALQDPRTSISYTKRVVAGSGIRKKFRVIENGFLELDDAPSHQTNSRIEEYVSDDGELMKFRRFTEQLAGSNVLHTVQCIDDDFHYSRYNYPRNMLKPPRQISDIQYAKDEEEVVGIFGKQKLGYFCVVGNNRDQSGDSRHGSTMLTNIPEDWLIGEAIGVLLSGHEYFAQHSSVSGVEVSALQWIISTPMSASRTIKAILKKPERIGLLRPERHRIKRARFLPYILGGRQRGCK